MVSRTSGENQQKAERREFEEGEREGIQGTLIQGTIFVQEMQSPVDPHGQCNVDSIREEEGSTCPGRLPGDKEALVLNRFPIFVNSDERKKSSSCSSSVPFNFEPEP